MDIRANDVYRAMLQQCKLEVAEADVNSQARMLVEFADFVLSDATTESAVAVKYLLDNGKIATWDEQWVIPELARAALEALSAWQTIAKAVLDASKDCGDLETIQELQHRFEACIDWSAAAYR